MPCSPTPSPVLHSVRALACVVLVGTPPLLHSQRTTMPVCFADAIGIPLLYFVLLFRHRHVLNPRTPVHGVGPFDPRFKAAVIRARSKDQSVRHIVLLWGSYEPKYYVCCCCCVCACVCVGNWCNGDTPAFTVV